MQGALGVIMRLSNVISALELDESDLMPVYRQLQVAPIADVSAAVADVLEHPLGFPPLRRALTPDDHVAIVVDERLPHLDRMLVPLLEHLAQAHIESEAITLISTDADSKHEWSEA